MQVWLFFVCVLVSSRREEEKKTIEKFNICLSVILIKKENSKLIIIIEIQVLFISLNWFAFKK